MRIMITGGGTGGHTSPAVAIIEELHARDPRLELQWVGCRDSIEERVCKGLSIPFRAVPVRGWPRSNPLAKLWAGARLAAALGRALILLQKFRPQVVLGVGGYVSVPLTLAAQLRGIPSVVHEQNKRMGLANRMLASRAHRILLSYPETIGPCPEDRTLVVGNPVRQGFSNPPGMAAARRSLDLDPDLPVVLVTGGSQGAASLNRAMESALPRFEVGEMQFIWMAGPRHVGKARQAVAASKVPVTTHGFIDDMVTACAAASLIVGRSGASSTAEIAQMGKPSILVPYPHATDNHQEQNARAFEEAGAATVLPDAECTGERLSDLIRSLLGDEKRLSEMAASAKALARPVAVETIVEEIFASVFDEAR